MRALRLLAVSAAAMLTMAAGPAVNWNARLAQTVRGTYVLGNPNAKVKLGEYVSYTCPHCAHFQVESEAALRLQYVRSGQVSIEINHLLRDPVDATIAQLTNCGAKDRFLINHSMFLRSQDRWIGLIGTASQAQRNRWYTGTRAERMRAIASDFRFYEMMATRGYTRLALDQCINDEALSRRLAAISEAAEKLGVDHTPSFTINGSLLVGTSDWRLLEPQIAARL